MTPTPTSETYYLHQRRPDGSPVGHMGPDPDCFHCQAFTLAVLAALALTPVPDPMKTPRPTTPPPPEAAL